MGRVYKRDDKYWIDYTDHRGRRIRKVAGTDKSVAQKILSDALVSNEKMRSGVLMADPREGKRALEVHIEAYLGDLHRRGRDEMYTYIVRKHIEAAAKEQGWQRLADCSVRDVSAYLRMLADRRLSAKTVNAHRADLAAFFGWCVRQRLLEANPCEQVPKSAVKAEKKRRALSVAECQALLAASPADRAAAYLFLVYTGLRRAEAAALRWGHVHIEVANPYVELPASITKSERRETVPLVPDLAEALRQRRGKAKDAHPVFDAIPSMPEFRDDLAAAGIEEEDARGRKVVLHSLRHTLCTMLAISNVPMAIAQRIMRHRDIKLTAEAYMDEGLLPLSAGMAALPSLASAGDSLGSPVISGAKYVPTSGQSVAQRGTASKPGRSAAAS
ncbi:MAG: tyrosine-type recombinase/integrase [Phycisphaeraceae bacterium]|nr:tyrosine-type recombinase/integrase [Phycisphaeraceae bacterium]